MVYFSSFCTLLSSSLSPEVKALFFSFSRAFSSGVTQGLLLEKHRTRLLGTVLSTQKLWRLLGDTVRYTVNVLPMWAAEGFPVRGVKAVPQLLLGLLSPDFDCRLLWRLPLAIVSPFQSVSLF